MNDSEQPQVEENKMPKWLAILWLLALAGVITYITVQLRSS